MKKNQSRLSNGTWIKNQRGYILVTTYILMAAASVITLANCMHNAAFVRDMERQRNAIVALEQAEGAVDQALVTLASNSNYAGTYSTAAFNVGTSRGGYDIAVTTPVGAPSNIRLITTTGHAPDPSATGGTTNAENLSYKTSTEKAYIRLPTSSYFTMAAYAIDSMLVSGTPNVNSYNSGTGVNGHNGDLGTSGTANNVMALTGAASIDGDIFIGVGGNTATAISLSGVPTVTGTEAAQTANPSFPTPTAPSASTGNLTIAGHSTVTLAAGTYVYTNVSVAGSGRLATTGAVTIYATGTVNLAGGGVVAASNIPANLKIYVTTNSSVVVEGTSAMYAALYAPLSSVTIRGTGDVYGAAVGKTMTLSGTGHIHYDEALNNVIGGTSNPSLLTWVQNGNQNWTN